MNHNRKVYLKEGLNREDLVQRIMNCDLCISDFDYTDVYSPAFNLALSKIRFGNFLKLMEFAFKYFTTGIKFNDCNAQEKWEEFTKRFIIGDDDIKKAKEYVEKNSKKLIFDGVKEFYENFFCEKPIEYFTRSPLYLVRPISDIFGIKDIIYCKEKKSANLEKFILENQWYQNYFIKGDSDVDEEMLDVLNYYKNKSYIQDVVSCHIAKTKKDINCKFDLNLVGRSYIPFINFLGK